MYLYPFLLELKDNLGIKDYMCARNNTLHSFNKKWTVIYRIIYSIIYNTNCIQ